MSDSMKQTAGQGQQGLQSLLSLACQAARAAGAAILEIYTGEDFEVSDKANHSPLTAADLAAHRVIKDVLVPSALPLLSEEGRDIPYAERRQWQRFWLVDPLDGTKEFIKRNGEFTVNIALIEAGQPILGVVYVPVRDQLYFGARGLGVWKEAGGQTTSLQTVSKPLSTPGLRVVASRSHRDAETESFLAGLTQPEVVSMGSSLKFMLLAEGSADLYPRFAPTMEWDTAAAQAVLELAGGSLLVRDTGQPLSYNKPELRNPHFLARA